MKLSDMLFANAMMGEGGGGGGGGSSDLTTATVTVVNRSSAPFYLYGAFVFEEGELGEGAPAISYGFIEVNTGGDETIYTVALYKGAAGLIFLDNVPEDAGCEVVVSGDITYSNGFAVVTGDGSLTIDVAGE